VLGLTVESDRRVFVCQYTNCLHNGSAEVLEAFQAHPVPDVAVVATSCLGQCSTGPTVIVSPDETWYCRVKPTDVPTIVEQHLIGNKPVTALLHPRFHPKY